MKRIDVEFNFDYAHDEDRASIVQYNVPDPDFEVLQKLFESGKLWLKAEDIQTELPTLAECLTNDLWLYAIEDLLDIAHEAVIMDEEDNLDPMCQTLVKELTALCPQPDSDKLAYLKAHAATPTIQYLTSNCHYAITDLAAE